jgi:hypothetical protein
MTNDQMVKALDDAIGLISGVRTQLAGVTPPPSFYTATTDRTPHARPTPLVLGPAGFTFTDPTFGTRMLRVSDEKANNGQSVHVASNSNLSGWNADGTRFYVTGSGGNVLVYAFDRSAFTATLLPVKVPNSNVEPCFSYGDPDLLWCVSGTNLHQVLTFSLSTGKKTVVTDLEQRFPSVAWAGTYVGSFQVVDHDQWFAIFGGSGQDQHTLAYHGGRDVVMDTKPLGWKLHAGALARDGRYLLLFPTGADLRANPSLSQVQTWDTQTGALVPMAKSPGGHGSLGFGVYINQDSYELAWDAAQWLRRDLATPDVVKSLIPDVQRPKETYLADHQSWRANTTGNAIPVVSSTYRGTPPAGAPAEPWRAWDEEIIAIVPDGSGRVHRFCHHQSTYGTGSDFWDQPIVTVDPTGKFAVFTSNWGKTVGAGRQDVFLAALT